MARRAFAKEDSLARYHLETVPETTERLLRQLSGARWTRQWYLAGGTALALHYGHRTSVDLDFFAERRTFDADRLVQHLHELGVWRTTATDAGTIYGSLGSVKASFIAYPWFRPEHIERVGYLRILGPDDIAVMKVLAVAQRGRRRDFVDLFSYCERGHALGDLLERVRRQYSNRSPDIAHLLRSLTFFADAEKDPPVRLAKPVPWRVITAFFEREVRYLGKRYFGV